MRWLTITLAAAATALATPAAAQSYGYGNGYSQPYQGTDFDWRRCHQNESAAACRNRLQQRRDTRYGDYRYDYSRDYPRDSVNYGYNSAYEYYSDSRTYSQGYPYSGGGYSGGSSGYGTGGYYGGSSGYSGQPYGQGGYYGGSSGYDSGAALALTVLGVALGVQILGSLDDRDHYDRNRHDRDWRDWCRDRYSSFDWSSGTYMGNDGYRRYCRRH
jgi:hypothetical protein